MAKKKDPTELEAKRASPQPTGWRSPEEIMGGGGLPDALTKRVMERALEGELTDHLGEKKHPREGHSGGNSRNGRTRSECLAGGAAGGGARQDEYRVERL